MRGLKSNAHFTHQLLNQLDIAGLSEHWLHSYESKHLLDLHPEFNFLSASSPTEEDPLFCRPRYLRGHGGVAIAWRKSFDKHTHRLDTSQRVTGMQLLTRYRPLCIFSVSPILLWLYR